MDKSMIADVESLPEADKQRMANMIDQLEIRDSIFCKF
jgi:import inner membrane translocase subunit TIM9